MGTTGTRSVQTRMKEDAYILSEESRELYFLALDEQWDELEARVRSLSNPSVLLQTNFEALTLLDMVCYETNPPWSTVEALLEAAGPEIVSLTDASQHNQTALHYAVQHEAPRDFIRLLIQTNPNVVSIEDAGGFRPLDYVIARIMMKEERRKYDSDETRQANEKQVENLWACAVDMVHALADTPMSEPDLHAFIYAGSQCPVSLRERFLYHCRLDRHKLIEKDKDGNTPLHVAASLPSTEDGEEEEVVAELLQACPEAVSLRNNIGKLPFDLAVAGGRPWETVKVLFEAYPEALEGRDIPIQYYSLLLAELSKKFPVNVLNSVVKAKPDLFKPSR